MSIHSILVATDLSVAENAAVQRACELARHHGATLTLMYMPPRDQPVPHHAASQLAGLARQLQGSPGLRVRAAPVQVGKVEELVEQAQGTDLLVLPHRRERSTAAFFRGQPVLRLLRACRCPVLVVRDTGAPQYRLILVAVDFSPESEALVKLAADLDPRAELEVFHAIDTLDEAKLRSAEATEQSIRTYRERCARYARQRMLTLTDSFDARRNRVRTVIGRGDPGRQTVIQQEHSGADLVVVGKKRASAWEDFFCGSVAHRVLSWGNSDVLVVPHAYVQATAPVAADRIRTGQVRAALRAPAAGRSAS